MPAAVTGIGDVTGSVDNRGEAPAVDAMKVARVTRAAAAVRPTCTAGLIEKEEIARAMFVSTLVGKPS
jgi:hypothetical protein